METACTVAKMEVDDEEETPPPGVETASNKRKRSVPRKRSQEPPMVVKLEPSCSAAGLCGSEVGPPAWRHCEMASCQQLRPLCISLADARCSLSDVTARWWHLSSGEHFCENCRDGLAAGRCSEPSVLTDLALWLRHRPLRSKASSVASDFMAGARLPFWLRCLRCAKWRQLPRRMEADYGESEARASFECARLRPIAGAKACEVPEDERVALARSTDFLSSITYQPLLQSSPVADLFPDYAPHEVGMVNGAGRNDVTKAPATPAFLRPFVEPGVPPLALQMPPDEILPQEALECEELTSRRNLRLLYLGLRNLIIGLWSRDVKQWLSPSKLSSTLHLRGLLRICIIERFLPRLTAHLTERGIINFGLLPRSVPSDLNPLLQLPANRRHRCVVIGAGLTGLLCAQQLHRFGCEVVVLEAKAKPGGRLSSISVPSEVAIRPDGDAISVPLGQHLLQGAINNPVAVLAYQAGMRLLPVADTAVLLSADRGGPVPASVELRSEFHFLAVCERMRREREAYIMSAQGGLEDRSFEEEYVKANRRALEKLTDMTEDHLSLLRFFEADLEAANAAPMSDLSWLHWDCAESYSQFGGALCLPNGDPNCLQTLCDRLAEGLDIRYGSRVTAVEEGANDGLVAITAAGKRFVADRVAHSGAWTQLWCPGGLSVAGERGGKAATSAAARLGCGRRETLLLLFPERFWDAAELSRGQLFFGRVGGRDETRGLCHLFEDLDPEKKEVAALGTVLFGDALQLWSERPLDELVAAVVAALAALFPSASPDALQPLWSHRSRIGLSQGFWAVGSSREDCAVLAQPQLRNRFFFVGEGAFANFSQSPAGFALSGLSAAYRIASS